MAKTELQRLREDVKKLYTNTGSLWCPAIKDNVVFNRHGLNHLSYKKGGRKRNPKDSKHRHRLFSNVHEVVKSSKVYLMSPKEITSRRGVKREATFYELIWLCKGQRKHTSVILRKIKEQKIHYYSVRRTNDRIKKALI